MSGRWLTRWLTRLFANDATRRALAESFADSQYELRTAAGKRAAIRARLAGGVAILRVFARSLIAWPLDEAPFFGLSDDVRHGWRRLRRSPLFTFVAVMTLALGIGVNTAIFSFVNGVMLREVPLRNVDRVVAFGALDRFGQTQFSIGDELAQALQRTPPAPIDAFFESSFLDGALTGADGTSIVGGEWVSGFYFEVLDVHPIAGQLLAPANDHETADIPVVLSARLWRQRFHEDPSLIGRRLAMAGRSLIVIGIAPADFRGARSPTVFRSDIWAPAWAKPLVQSSPGANLHRLFGRLRPTATAADAGTAVARIAASAAPGIRVLVRPGIDAILGDRLMRAGRSVGGAFIVLSGLVFVIACGNLANLLMARGASRSGEMAVRLSTGASRLRIVRLFLVETLLLIGCASILSTALTIAVTRAVAAMRLPAGQGVDIVVDVSPDYRVLLFGLAIVALAAVVVGFIPAWRVARMPAIDVMKAGGAGHGSGRRSRLMNFLVAAQIGSSLVLLLGAGLYARSALYIDRLDPGFEVSRAAMVSMDLRLLRVDEARGRALFDRALEAASDLPGVESAALVSELPTALFSITANTLEVSADGVPPPRPPPGRKDPNPRSFLLRVSPGALHVLGIRLLDGRDFRNSDDAGTRRVTIVSESLARLIWPGRNPIGRRLALGPTPVWLEVVGVAADTRLVPVRDRVTLTPGLPLAYVPVSQQYGEALAVIVRSAPGVTPASLVPALQQAVRRADPEVAFFDDRTMADAVSGQLLPMRLGALVFFTLGGLGFGIAMLGLYGLMSHVAALRVREFGIRKALGATGVSLYAMVVRHGLRLLGPGVVVGLGVAYLTTRAIRGRVFGVGEHDPITFIGMPALLVAAAIVACLVPARRASRVDPNVVLREL